MTIIMFINKKGTLYIVALNKYQIPDFRMSVEN